MATQKNHPEQFHWRIKRFFSDVRALLSGPVIPRADRLRAARRDPFARTVILSRLSVLWSALMTLGKLVLGLGSASVFLCLHAFYTFCMGLARFLFLRVYTVRRDAGPLGESDTQAPRIGARTGRNAVRRVLPPHRSAAYLPSAPARCFAAMGGIVLAASTLYMLYSLRLFFGVSSPRYHKLVAVAIAVFTFTEIALNIHGSVTAYRREDRLLHALRLTNLAASLICLPLAQAAILSFTSTVDLSFYNGLSGLIFGAFAAIIGLSMLVHRPVPAPPEPSSGKEP